MDLYYVYAHIHPETQEVMYIGMGSGGRAWGVLNRNKKHHPEHRKFLDELLSSGYIPSDWVIIIDRELSKEDAYLKELQLIHESNIPKFNKANGEKQWCAKLNKAHVLEIKKQIKSGIKYKDIALAFGVCKGTIDKIAQNKTHRGIS